MASQVNVQLLCSTLAGHVQMRVHDMFRAWQVGLLESKFKWRYHDHAHSKLNMTEEFLSLKEAEKHTGKSRSTLRRFVVSITKPENHSDRHLIKPSVEEVEKLHSENHPFSWMVNKFLLDREFPKQGTQQNQENQLVENVESSGLLSKTISMLENELSEKNKQIAQFQERDRETNILIQQMNEKLVHLTEGKKAPQPPVDEAVTVSQNEKGSQQDKANQTEKRTVKSLWQKLNKPIFIRK